MFLENELAPGEMRLGAEDIAEVSFGSFIVFVELLGFGLRGDLVD